METQKDLIVGVHSIACAIKNSERSNFEVFATEDGMDELKKRGQLSKDDLARIENIKLLAPHKLQEMAEQFHNELGHNYKRVPSGIFMLANPIQNKDLNWIYEQLKCGKLKKIICLDGVTDTHNAAAILRTASFYGADCMLVSVKGNFGNTPSFFRIASGATEFVPIISCSGLPKAIKKLQELGVFCLGLSEHSTSTIYSMDSKEACCVVLGAEDHGMSHAVTRVIENKVSLLPKGDTQSLNVSVAAAVFMEKFF